MKGEVHHRFSQMIHLDFFLTVGRIHSSCKITIYEQKDNSANGSLFQPVVKKGHL